MRESDRILTTSRMWRDLQLSSSLVEDPLVQNLVATLIQVFYYKICYESISWLRRKRFDHAAVSKPLVSMLLPSTVVFTTMYDTSHWSWRLNVVLPVAVAIRLIYKGSLVQDPEDIEVQILASSPSRLLQGPFLQAFIMIWLGLYYFGSPQAALVAAALWGDALSPLLGHVFGRHQYRIALSRQHDMESFVVGVLLGTVKQFCRWIFQGR